MKTWIAVMLAFTALGARAEVSMSSAGTDPLTRQILSRQLRGVDSGITGAVRVGSGEVIELRVPELAFSAVGEDLKDAVADPKSLAPLKPAAGLAKTKARDAAKTRDAKKARRAADQLKTVSERRGALH